MPGLLPTSFALLLADEQPLAPPSGIHVQWWHWAAFGLFVAVMLAIKRQWLPFAGALAGVIATSLLGLATVQAYRRFLNETDELRRKIEVEALALAFGIGLFGGLSYWLLELSGAVPAAGFVWIFLVMIVTHPVAVLIGLRRYS